MSSTIHYVSRDVLQSTPFLTLFMSYFQSLYGTGMSFITKIWERIQTHLSLERGSCMSGIGVVNFKYSKTRVKRPLKKR